MNEEELITVKAPVGSLIIPPDHPAWAEATEVFREYEKQIATGGRVTHPYGLPTMLAPGERIIRPGDRI